MNPKLPRGKLVGEFVLVVLGVLVALMFDSWMEDRANGRLRQEYLVRLADDLKTDRQNYQYRIEFYENVRDFAIQTLATLNSNPPVDADDVLTAYYASEIFTISAVSSTYQDLQNTGNIRLISDIELRLALSSYQEKAARELLRLNENYREIVRGVIPWDMQKEIRENCPTLDDSGEIPTGFPPCDLPGISPDEAASIFAAIRSHTQISEILTYRISDVSTGIYLFSAQKKMGEGILALLD